MFIITEFLYMIVKDSPLGLFIFCRFDFILATLFSITIFFLRTSNFFYYPETIIACYRIMLFGLIMLYAIPLYDYLFINPPIVFLITPVYVETYSIKLLLVFFWFLFVHYLFYYHKYEYFRKRKEYMLCFDFALCGSIFFLSSYNILEMYIGLEIIAFPTYALIALDKARTCTKAALEYFIYSVLASLLFVVNFIFFFVASGQTSLNYFTYYSDSTKIYPAVTFWIVTFCVKLGIGPFYHFFLSAFKYSSGPVFVFLSTISKIPFVFPFICLIKSPFVSANSEPFYLMVFYLTWGAYLAARDLLTERNFRLIIAYTSTINFSTVVTAFIFSLYNTKLLIAFIASYILSSFAVYLWYHLINYDEESGEDVVISNFRDNDFARILMNISLIFNSGFPPITLYIFKILVVGGITFVSPELNATINTDIAVIFVGINLTCFFIYFKILKGINYFEPTKIFDVYQGIDKRDYSKYDFAILVTLLNIIFFSIIIYYF